MKGKHETRNGRWTAVDTLYWLGGALISGGFGCLLLPLGLISAGVFAILGAVLIDRSGKGGDVG